MKHFTLLTGKRHILLVLIMLLCSVRVACADDSGLVTQQITVNVPTAGTLSNIIQSDKMFKITNLKITGFLNSDDIRFIRKMAGCYYNGNGSKYDGHLQYLDLGSISQISYVHSFEFYDENGYRSTLNDCLFPLAYLYNLKTVVLPNLYKDYNFSLMGCRNLTTAKMPDNLEKIGNNTFKDCSSLVDISLSPTITSIGEYAFSGCSSLTEIQIPVNVTYIGQYAFYGCSSLKGINVPTDFVNISASTFENCANLQYFFNYNYIESIGDRAFAGCSKLTQIVNLFVGSPSIGTYVFENCKSLKNVRGLENIKTLPRGMFKGCSSLSSITLPQYLLSIDDYAFEGCSSLADIKLPIYLNSLGYRALADCSKLTSLDLPSSLQSIGSYAFAGCNAMERIDANMAAPITASQSTFNGIDFSNCYLYVPTGAYQSYWLANGWGSFEHIIDNLDPQKSKMVTLETPGTLKDKIGSNEKFSITHLKVSGPINTNDIQYIREMAGCYYDTNGSKYNGSLHHLDLRDASYSADGHAIDVYDPAGNIALMYIANFIMQGNDLTTTHLFFGLDGLQTVILPNNEKEIGEHMFEGCYNLKSIEIPLSVQAIRSYAFFGCSSLEALQLPYGITCIEDAVFDNCFNLKEIKIPESVTTINGAAFVNCRSLTSITIPDNVTSIGVSAFNGCSNLRYISLPSNIKYIGECTFSNSGIREITLPQQVTEITNNMFEGCQNLKHIYLHDGLKSIGDYAFQYCNSLGGRTLPNSVTKIGKGCFSHCDYLKAGVTLSDAITEIPEEAFAYCGCLYEIKLPAELKRIGYRAFCGSPYIGSFGGLKIPSKVTEIAPEAFYKSFQEIEVLELPANLKTVGDYAFAACSAKVIYAYMSEPFALGDDDFYGLPRSECKLYVPKGCAKKYRQAEIWKEFDIEEMEVTGIASVTNDSTAPEVARYDANGNLLVAPAKGLNIVHYSDGTVKKIMVE